MNMSLKTKTEILIFLVTSVCLANSERYALGKFLVVSGTDDSDAGQNQKDYCTEEIEAALCALNKNVTDHLQETERKLEEKLCTVKQEIIDAVQAVTNTIPRDCKEIRDKGYEDSDVYPIHPYLVKDEFSVFCDMTTRGGGWTYVVNRVDGSQNFYLNWTDYKNGFGNPSGEYWLGLERLYHLTNSKPNELLVELLDWDSKKVYAHYSNFKIGSDSEGYKLKSVGNYTGDAGDSLSVHLGNKFSTLDRDQDTYSGNCASVYPGAWWYASCFHSHLTGRYVNNSNPVPYASGLHWREFHGYYYSLKEARMMIRPFRI